MEQGDQVRGHQAGIILTAPTFHIIFAFREPTFSPLKADIPRLAKWNSPTFIASFFLKIPSFSCIVA
jgi:hypothetical protein